MNRFRARTWFVLSPLWRWKWLWIVFLLATICYAFLSISDKISFITNSPVGMGQVSPQDYTTSAGYGWPLKYECRYYSPDTTTTRRFIWSDVAWFSGWRLGVNLGVAIGLSMLLTWCVAWRFSLSGRWQFGLRDLAALTVAVALFVGIGRYWERVYQNDRTYVEGLAPHPIHFGRDYSTVYWNRRPWRDLGLISGEASNPAALEFSNLFEAPLDVKSDEINQLLISETNAGRRLRHPLTSISFRGVSLNDAGVAALTRFAGSCQELQLAPEASISDAATAKIVAAWPDLVELKFGSPQLTRTTFQTLQNLPQLEVLAISDCSREVTQEDIDLLRQLPNLQRLGLPDHVLEKTPAAEFRQWSAAEIEVYECQTFHSEWIEAPLP